MRWLDGITNGHELGQIPGDGEGQGSLACCSPSGHEESDNTWQLNNNNINITWKLWAWLWSPDTKDGIQILCKLQRDEEISQGLRVCGRAWIRAEACLVLKRQLFWKFLPLLIHISYSIHLSTLLLELLPQSGPRLGRESVITASKTFFVSVKIWIIWVTTCRWMISTTFIYNRK